MGPPLGPLAHLQLEVSWPLESSGGKWLLYLMEINLDGSPEHRCATPGDIVNPLNLTVTIATTSQQPIKRTLDLAPTPPDREQIMR